MDIRSWLILFTRLFWCCAEIPTNLGIYLLDVLYKKDK